MESDLVSSQERLDRMPHDGKIDRQEYERLRSALEGNREKTQTTRIEGYFARPPWQIWVVVALLAVEGIGNLMAIPRMPIAAYWLAAKCVLILGLLKGWKWVFVLALIIVSIHVLFFAVAAPVTALLNLVLLVLIASARRFYFPKKDGLSKRI